MKGWVKLHRQSIKNGWLRNHKLWVFWTYCLMRASGIETQELQQFRQVKLSRGQFIFGLKQACKDTGLTYQSARTCLATLMKWGNINKQSNNQFSVITILKYETYNPLNDYSNSQPNKQLTNEQQTTNIRLTTLKKDKNVKKDKYIGHFNILWEKHPKKIGRAEAIKAFQKSVHSEKDCARIEKALNNYLACKQVADGFIQNGKRWFKEWEDWVDFIEIGKETESERVIREQYKGVE